MEYHNLSVEKENRIVVVTIDRPKFLNALNTETLKELEDCLKALNEDPSVRVVLITGKGKSFVAGADVKEMHGMNEREAFHFSLLGHRVLVLIQEMDKPVIAVVNGFALGGGLELAMACDLIIASEKAKLGLPEVNLGVFPGFGGTQRLARLVGTLKAREMIFTGEAIDARTAREIGLVNQVLPDDELLMKAKELAQRIAEKSGNALALAKKAVNQGREEMGLSSGLALERELFARSFTHPDQKEGMTAFVEKRKPKFQ
jgi:enoyl-CoA hydratase